MTTRNHNHDTPLAFRLRRLGLSLAEASRWTRAPYGNLKNWNQGRTRCPRPVLRLLAAYRWAKWGKF